jgi:hypothetical protein
MHPDEIRAALDEEARALVPHPPDLWPRVAAALAHSRWRPRPRLRRWMGGLAALVLAALAAAAALFSPLAGSAEDRLPASAAPVPATAMAATEIIPPPVATPTPALAAVSGDAALAPWLTPAPVALPASGLGLPAASFPSPPAGLGR